MHGTTAPKGGLRASGKLELVGSNEQPHKPPYNLEAEQSLLGTLMLWKNAFEHVTDILEPGHFYDPLHQEVYRTALQLHANNRAVNPITLKPFFENTAPVDEHRTVFQYLGSIAANANVGLPWVRGYALTIRDLATRREMILIAEDMRDAAYDSPVDFPPAEQIVEAETKLFELASRDCSNNSLMLAEEIPITSPDDGPIAGLVWPRSTVVWYGPSGAGKSTLVIDAVHAICAGRPWMGRQTRQGSVLYVALEGQAGLGARLAAARAEHGEAGGRLGVLYGPVQLGRGASGTSSASTIIAAARQLMQKSGMAVSLIVVDTYARALAGDDENDAATVAAVLAQTSCIIGATGAAVLFIHHPGKDRERGPRGSYALYGAVDGVVEIERDDGASTRNIIARKVRDGPEGPVGAFSLKPLTVGIQGDGAPVNACVVVPEDRAASAEKKAVVRLTPGARIALDALRYALDEAGEPPPPGSAHIPNGVARVVLVDRWRTYSYQKGISPSGEPRARQQAFKRGSESLISARRVGVWDPYAWLIE